MALPDVALLAVLRAIAAGDAATVSELLTAAPALAGAALDRGASRTAATEFFLDGIGHYVYAGDTALHVAAASHRAAFIRALVSSGADIAARNRRGAQPLHYAADGDPSAPAWDPQAQAATIAYLIEVGADPNATDSSGVTPLHRAIRTRCAAAVGAWLEGGADVHRPNRTGSTPLLLATRATGRSGSGSPVSKAQQREIEHLLARHGARA